MTIRQFKEKIVEKKNKVRRFIAKHDEAICVAIGAMTGAFIGGYILGNEIIKAEASGYENGCQRGSDAVFDDLWENAANAGGHYSERFINGRNGRRIGLTVDLLPTKED